LASISTILLIVYDFRSVTLYQNMNTMVRFY
jgi:hypothetical protein